MDSSTLKYQREKFVSSANQYKDKYKDILLKLKSINLALESSNDTLLYKHIQEKNEQIIKKIDKLCNNVDKYKNLTVKEVNNKIYLLEKEEQEKAQEDLDDTV